MKFTKGTIENNLEFINDYNANKLKPKQQIYLGSGDGSIVWFNNTIHFWTLEGMIELPKSLLPVIIKIIQHLNNTDLNKIENLTKNDLEQYYQYTLHNLKSNLVNGRFKN